MKPKTHRFIVTATTYGSQESAKNAILSAFAQRHPDNCSFAVLAHSVYHRRQRLRMLKNCEEARKRLSAMPPEERLALEKRGREIIAQAVLKMQTQLAKKSK